MSKVIQNSEDISSYSNFKEIIQKEIDIDVSLDFEQKQMIGTMDVQYEIFQKSLY
jgi:hypothetical protein